MTDVRLDTIPGCIAELTSCNSEVAGFAHRWAEDAGNLKQAEKRYERLYRAAMRGTSGANADERQATAHAAVDEVDEGLAERIEGLVGSVEQHKRLFETIERRSSNAQSILSAHRRAAELDGFVPREAREMARRAA